MYKSYWLVTIESHFLLECCGFPQFIFGTIVQVVTMTFLLQATNMLSSTTSTLVLVGVFSLYLIGSYAYSWYRLRHLPGPWLASISYLWMFRTSVSGREGLRYKEITDQYGHLVRIGPNDVITDDPEVIRRIGAARSTYKRSDWYQALRMNPYRESLFNVMDTAAHDKLKAQMSFGYGGRETPTMEHSLDRLLETMVNMIRRKYISTDQEFRPMDMSSTAQYFTLDSITKIAYGREFGYLETDSDVHSYVETTETYVPTIVLFGEVPLLRKIFFSSWVLKLFGPKPTDKSGYGVLIK